MSVISVHGVKQVTLLPVIINWVCHHNYTMLIYTTYAHTKGCSGTKCDLYICNALTTRFIYIFNVLITQLTLKQYNTHFVPLHPFVCAYAEIKTAPSVASFKYRLNRDLHKPPNYFNSGPRLGQILHARLRMDCSSLNAHLYRKNIVLSPSCSCGGFESAYHFFFKCPNYL